MYASRSSCISLTDSYQVVRPFTLRCLSRSVRYTVSEHSGETGADGCGGHEAVA